MKTVSIDGYRFQILKEMQYALLLLPVQDSFIRDRNDALELFPANKPRWICFCCFQERVPQEEIKK